MSVAGGMAGLVGVATTMDFQRQRYPRFLTTRWENPTTARWIAGQGHWPLGFLADRSAAGGWWLGCRLLAALVVRAGEGRHGRHASRHATGISWMRGRRPLVVKIASTIQEWPFFNCCGTRHQDYAPIDHFTRAELK